MWHSKEGPGTIYSVLLVVLPALQTRNDLGFVSSGLPGDLALKDGRDFWSDMSSASLSHKTLKISGKLGAIFVASLRKENYILVNFRSATFVALFLDLIHKKAIECEFVCLILLFRRCAERRGFEKKGGLIFLSPHSPTSSCSNLFSLKNCSSHPFPAY